MADLLFSHKTVEDLTAIWNCTVETWSEAQADKYYTLLVDTCRQIATAPGRRARSTLKSWQDCSVTERGNTSFSIGGSPNARWRSSEFCMSAWT